MCSHIVRVLFHADYLLVAVAVKVQTLKIIKPVSEIHCRLLDEAECQKIHKLV